jgi:hypothetical protein
MAAYLQRENQSLLWNTLCTVDIFNEWNAPESDKARFVRENIESCYNNRIKYQSDPSVLSSNDLMTMNRDTVSNIVKRLQSQRYDRAPTTNRAPIADPMMTRTPAVDGAYGDRYRGYNNNSQHQDDYGSRPREFSAKKHDMPDYDSRPRHREYPMQPESEFSNLDKPIVNMDELMQQRLQNRDTDLKKYAVPLYRDGSVAPPKLFANGVVETVFNNMGGDVISDSNMVSMLKRMEEAIDRLTMKFDAINSKIEFIKELLDSPQESGNNYYNESPPMNISMEENPGTLKTYFN